MSNEENINNEESTEVIIPYESVVTNLSELLTNSVNMVDKFYEIFFDTNPHTVKLEIYNKQGELITIEIPNRAMDRKIAISGEGSPEGKVDSFLGALYIDSYNSQLYIKQTQEGNMGWQNITPQAIKVNYEEFSIASSINKVILSKMTDDNNPPDIYLDGELVYPEKYTIGYDKRTINFTETLSVGSKVLVKYMLGVYGLKGETALTFKIGGVETLSPRKQAYVEDIGENGNIVLKFGLPVGPLEWGNITGTLSNQYDIQAALNKKQNNLTAGNHISITQEEGEDGAIISAEDTWGGITGSIDNQTDLKNALNNKQNNLTAGNNIDITNNVISVTGELGAKATFRTWKESK